MCVGLLERMMADRVVDLVAVRVAGSEVLPCVVGPGGALCEDLAELRDEP